MAFPVESDENARSRHAVVDLINTVPGTLDEIVGCLQSLPHRPGLVDRDAVGIGREGLAAVAALMQRPDFEEVGVFRRAMT